MKKVFASLVLAGVGLIGLSFRILGYENTWKHYWNIPTLMPPFEDLRVITGAAESVKAGYDPTVYNAFDPWHQAFNYPQIWFPILHSPINVNWTIPLAIVCILVFYIGAILFPAKLDKHSVFALLLIIFSPAVMLGVERANVDIVTFGVLALALFLAEVSATLSLIMLLIGVLFKIFPLFAIAYFMDMKKRIATTFIVSGISFSAIYFVLTLTDLMRVFRTTLKGDDLSYGTLVLARRIVNEHLPGYSFFRFRLLHIPASVNYSDLRLAFYLAALIIMACAAYFGIRDQSNYQSGDRRNLRAFWAGAGIYICTFLLGNNHDYRLMFLLFTVPLLSEWSFRVPGKLLMPKFSLALTFLACWYLVISREFSEAWIHGAAYAYLLDQACKWALFFTLTYLFAASIPLPMNSAGMAGQINEQVLEKALDENGGIINAQGQIQSRHQQANEALST